MRRNRHLTFLFALGIVGLAAAAALPGSATAQRPGGAFGGFANNPGARLWAALNQRFEGFSERLALSDEQANSAAVLIADFREANEDALGRYDRMRAQMRDRVGGAARRGGGGGARRGAGGGNAQARQAMQEMRRLVDQLGPAFEVLHRDFSALLSEEQTETLTSLLQRQPRG
ncbi:MAG: hypothetical protein F4Z31_14345 [Gemmatimonadetes bacterium]|nr:hypothetical protein [Gemmatimonadota bacterium]MYE93745.1 hypothetical protein [Gemmatimonadota bacterium]MYJ09416.1 hypothetical protein [Gemmatimonadota bacterium]